MIGKANLSRGIPRASLLMKACIALVALSLVPFCSVAATKTIQVGAATSTSSFVPISLAWQDSWSECVYSAALLSDVPVGAKVKAISFEGACSAGVTDMEYSIYARHTTSSQAPANSAERSDLSDFTCLYDGTVSVASTGGAAVSLMPVDATGEFVYEGGNLHIIVKSHTTQEGGAIFYANSGVSRGTYLALSRDNWETCSRYNYNYVPVMNLTVELPAGYVDLQSVTVGNDDTYSYASTPLSMVESHCMSSSIYTSDMLGIPADNDIRQISYRGTVYTTSTGEHRIRVWMRNTDEVEPGESVPAVEAMTLVLDTTITMDSKQGGFNNWTEILKLQLDTPFRYTGGNLHVVIQADNEASQYVYFCQSNAYSGKSVYGYGSTDDMSSFSCYAGALPVTKFYYSEPEEVADPEISLVTAAKIGQKVGFVVKTSDDGGVRVDWGGKVSEYPYGGHITISHDAMGPEIKIWPMNPEGHITEFSCVSSDITSTTLNCPELTVLSLRNNQLESVDLSNCPRLEALELSDNNIFEFNYESPILRTLLLRHCSTEQLVISGCTGLERLDVSVNSLRYPIWLFWPEAPNMKELNISYNQILEFDLSRYPNLKTLICNNNNFETLDIAAAPGLEILRAGFTGVKRLAVDKCPGLKVLDVTGAQVGGMNLSRNTALEELEMRLSGVSRIDLSANKALKRLVLAQNSISEINLSANTAIEHLDIGNNSLSAIDLSKLAHLRYLDCSRNSLAELSLSANNTLDTLYCSLNALDELPLPETGSIRWADISSNKFTLLPEGLKNVKYLNCADNGFASLDISTLTELVGLDIHSNSLDKAALESIFRRLPDINGIHIPETDASWMGVLNYNDNPGTASVSSAVPETKGWNCSYKPDILGDANAAMLVPSDKMWTRISFAIDTPDPVYYVDWGDGKKVEYRTEDPAYTSNSLVGYVSGEVIKVYAPSTTALGVGNTGYEAIDVSGMPDLLRLSCVGNAFSSLDLSNNAEIDELICRDNPLTQIIFPENCALTSLDCSSTLLRSLDLARTPSLKWLAAVSCRLESVDLTQVPMLEYLHLGNNNLESVDLTPLSALDKAYLFNNKLASLDVSANKFLTVLSVEYNNLQSLDLTGLTQLKEVYVNSNDLTSFKVAAPQLSVLLMGKNRLGSVDLSGCPAITTMTLNDNQLKNVDLSNQSVLQQVHAGNNEIEQVVLPSSMPALRILDFESNNLSAINLQCAPGLKELNLAYNRFAGTFDISSNPALTWLNVSHNEIEDFKWSSSVALGSLYASYNKLTTLNVPSTELAVIDCSRNNLEAVNLSKHATLILCVLDFNRLTSLNVAANKILNGLSIRANDFDKAALERICTQLPDITEIEIVPGEESWMGIFYVSGNPGCADANFSEAISKGWTVVANESIPVDRVLTLNVSDNQGQPVENATLVLIVGGEDVGTQCRQTAPGVYTYNPLPVFNGYTYAVRIGKDGFKTEVVDVSEIVNGDLDINVTLEPYSGIEDMEAVANEVRGGAGSICFSLGRENLVTVYDLMGRVVFNGTLPAGDNRIDGIAPGIYITLGKKVRVY